MDIAKLRAWWAHRQRLDGRLEEKSPAEALAQTGWARSVGGAGPYLGIFARGGTRREMIDLDLQNTHIHELPSARGCTYVIPEQDFALALAVGQNFGGGDMNTARKLGVTDKEIDKLCDAINIALGKETLEPDALKTKLGDLVRNLGEAGKKKGLTTTLPLALGRLQRKGEIRRIPTNGRLDQQRYRYARWKKNPLKGFARTQEECFVDLARRYFLWIGPATQAEFAAFAGLGVGASKKALEPLQLQPMEAGSERLTLPELQKEFAAFKTPKNPHIVLTSSLDGHVLHRGELATLVDEKDWQSPIWRDLGMGKGGSTLKDLPSHSILDRGRLIGLWEYDPEQGKIVWATFGKPDSPTVKAVEKMEAFVRDDLGDARSFSLDSPKSRQPRIAALRKRMK